MAPDDFFRAVRRAVTFLAPRVETNSPFPDASYIERMLRGTDSWLAQDVVAPFRPEDFPDLDQSERNELADAVNAFLAVARSVPPNEPATSEQREAALRPFTHMVKDVQKLLFNDWIQLMTP